jgi:predicted small lipoprotein YifL
MKKIARLMVCILVVSAIAACGASPRSGRSPLSTDASKNAALKNSNPQDTDLYKFSLGSQGATVAIPNSVLASNYGINISVLNLSLDGTTPLASLSFLEFGIAVEKSTGRCGMYVWVDDQQVEPSFEGTKDVYSNTSSNITCKTSDGFSTLTIQIFPYTATAAWVMITDDTYGPLFTMQKSFAINPVE